MEQQLLKIGSGGSFFEVDFTIIILLLFSHLNSSLPTDTVFGSIGSLDSNSLLLSWLQRPGATNRACRKILVLGGNKLAIWLADHVIAIMIGTIVIYLNQLLVWD
jgi:hypothetical protein